MIEIILDGWLWWFVTFWVGLIITNHLATLIFPNWNIKKIVRTGKLPRDSITSGVAGVFMMLWIYVLLWLVGIV